MITAFEAGTTTIYAETANGLVATCKVKVVCEEPEIEKIQNTADGVRLSWDSVYGAEKYRVFYKGETNWIKLADTTSTTYVHKGAKSGKKYTYDTLFIREWKELYKFL